MICPQFEHLNSKSLALVAPGGNDGPRQYAEGGKHGHGRTGDLPPLGIAALRLARAHLLQKQPGLRHAPRVSLQSAPESVPFT